MDRTYSTDADIRDMVIETLEVGSQAPGEDFDIAAIVTDIVAEAEYDGRAYDLTNVDFWDIAERHDRSLAPLRAAADAHQRLQVAEGEVDRIRAERDDAIRAAIVNNTSMYAVGRYVGITQQAVARIRDRG